MKRRRGLFEALDCRDLLSATPSVWVSDAWALESAGKIQFPVTLTQPSSATIEVGFTTVAGSAGATDFTPLSGTLTFLAGSVQQMLMVPIVDDSLVESNETFQVALSNPSGAVLGQSTANGTILDDDFAPATAGDQVVRPTELAGIIKNPSVGYQTFYESASADSQLPSSTMYQRFDWNQIETAPGAFNFSVIDNALAAAQAAGQRLAFRIMPFEEGNPGPTGLKASLPGFSFTFSGTTTWVPDYNQPAVQHDLAMLIAALGARYGNNPAIDSVDIGFVGDWGEYHYWGISSPPPFPTTATLEWMFDQFRASFKVPLIITDPPADPTAYAYAVQHGIGWRVDSWGHWTGSDWTEQLNSYPGIVTASGDDWKTAPVILEPWYTMQSWSTQPWQQSLQWAIDNHVSEISNKSDTIPAAMFSAVQDMLTRLGYRFVLTQTEHAPSVQAGASFDLRLDWINKGNAPMYLDRNLVVKIGNRVVDTGVSMRSLLPGKRTDVVSLNTQGLAAGSYPLQIGLAAPGGIPDITLAITGGGPWYSVGTVNITNAANSTVVQTKLFYKGSTGWNVTNNNLPGFSDDNAIASDKTAYLPGSGAATFSAVSSYTGGINGLMVDLAGSHGTLTANDFIFKVGNNNSPSTWAAGAAPTLLTTRAGAGTGGSDRVELMWANNAIQKTWLEVIVKGNDALGGSNANTGLASSYVFYFGSAPGDSGAGDPTTFLVNSTDEISARNDPHSTLSNPAPITNVNDFNRDGNVNSTDQITSRNNGTSAFSNALKFLSVGAGGPFAPVSEADQISPAATSLSATESSTSGGDAGIASALAVGELTDSPTIAAAPPQIVERAVSQGTSSTTTFNSSWSATIEAEQVDRLLESLSVDEWLDTALAL